jgi:hypothetical protein
VASLFLRRTAAAAGGWTDWLDHWQTLLGAAVGGVMGVAGAMIVARAQHRREQRIAAGMVLPDLHQLVTATTEIERRLPLPQVGGSGLAADREQRRLKAQRNARVVKSLMERRPAPFALHSPAIGQLTDIDARLYGHLFQCEVAHRRFEDGVALAAAPDAAQSVAQLYEDWQRSALHARLAIYYLDRFVFSPWPRWLHRCRMKMWPNDVDRLSRKALPGSDRASTKPRAKRAESDADAAAPTEA